MGRHNEYELPSRWALQICRDTQREQWSPRSVISSTRSAWPLPRPCSRRPLSNDGFCDAQDAKREGCHDAYRTNGFSNTNAIMARDSVGQARIGVSRIVMRLARPLHFASLP